MAGPVAMPVKSLLRYSLQASMRKLAETRPLAPQPADIDRFLSLCHRRRYPSKAPIIRPGDVANNDGMVDVDDLNVVLSNWAVTCP